MKDSKEILKKVVATKNTKRVPAAAEVAVRL